MTGNQGVLNESAGNEMFLNDPLEHRRIALRVPRAFGIDDGNGPAFADPQAIRFGAKDAALLRQLELLQSPLEELPGRETALFLAALRVRLIAAEKDVTLRDRNADRGRDYALLLV